ncbi:hypothetical protein [Paenibacillus azoreducens]|uniref:hypothetical protein n=1 Tax=Paenibacillus azoreducens TaxID=116718 RepID=UPI001F1A8BDD|nr:hypothetical protein [Paenibacillus azoreducens]
MADDFDVDDEEPEKEDWKTNLELHHKTGMPLPTAGNVELFLTNGVWRTYWPMTHSVIRRLSGRLYLGGIRNAQDGHTNLGLG